MEVKGRGSRSRMRLAHRRRGGLRTPGERRTGLFVDGWMNGWMGMGEMGCGMGEMHGRGKEPCQT